MHVGEFKNKFSDILDEVRSGGEIAVAFGKKNEKVAVLIPYLKHKKTRKRKLGILENKAAFSIQHNFKITEEELFDA